MTSRTIPTSPTSPTIPAIPTIPTEPIGSIPRPPELLTVLARHRCDEATDEDVRAAFEAALDDTVARFLATGSPVISDGEQGKTSFATYPLEGLTNLAEDGVAIPFADGHARRLPRLAEGPFRYGRYAARDLPEAIARAGGVPVKQAVISASALSLLYPHGTELPGYPRERFLDDLVDEVEADIRLALDRGAHRVQIDFTEGRLAVKLDPSHALLDEFVALNNRVLARFSSAERARIGIHTCPGGDHDSTHSADVDYAELLPSLFRHEAGNFYVQMASEADPERSLALVGEALRPGQRVFVGVIDVVDGAVESPETVRDRVLAAARHIPLEQLGTCDDCGFSPFEDDTSTGRDVAFAKIAARVEGTRMAAGVLGG